MCFSVAVLAESAIVLFNDGYSFLCFLPLDSLVLDELSFGIDDDFSEVYDVLGSSLEEKRTDDNLLEVLVPSNVRLERVSSSMSVSNTSSRLVGKSSLFILDMYSITFSLIAKFLLKFIEKVMKD